MQNLVFDSFVAMALDAKYLELTLSSTALGIDIVSDLNQVNVSEMADPVCHLFFLKECLLQRNPEPDQQVDLDVQLEYLEQSEFVRDESV